MNGSDTALVSGCDANYYPLLREWLHSVQRFAESKALDICVLDAGLTAAQAKEFFKRPTTVRLNVRGQVQYVDSATLYFGLRIIGD